MESDDARPGGAAQQFSLWLWPEAVGPGQVEWRGKLQHLPTGETCYFRGLESLPGRLGAMMDSDRSAQNPA